MSLTNETATFTVPLKYVWNVSQENLEKWRNKVSISSPLFGPANFENTKFKLQFDYDAAEKVQYNFNLILISCSESSLDLKYKMFLKKASVQKLLEMKRDNYINLPVGKQMMFLLRNFINVEYAQVEIELNLPKKLETPLIKLAKDLNSLRSKARFADVTFVVGTKEFPAHKDILSARSPVFEVMFTFEEFVENQQNRVDITDIDEKVFGALLDFIYTAEVSNLHEVAPELLVVAHKYDIRSLFDVCAQCMYQSMTKENVVHYLVHAKMYNLELLKDKAIDLINRNAQELTNREDFVRHVKPDHLLMHELYLDFVNRYPRI